LEAAIREMDRVGADLAKWRPLAALGDVRRNQGRLDEAKDLHLEAAARLERIASGLPDERLRHLFLAKDEVRAKLNAVV
jgi:hypothetical protein